MTNEEKIGQLQLYEQSLQTLLLQKQQFQAQLTEIDSAREGLKSSSEAYKIIGNIMVKTDQKNLSKEMEEKHKKLTLRLTTIEKQEEDIKKKAKSLREDIMEGMKEDDK